MSSEGSILADGPVRRIDGYNAHLLRILIREDVAGYARGLYPVHLFLLAPVAAWLAAWFGTAASPLVPLAIVLCAGFEPRINNVLFGSRNDVLAFSIMPVPWQTIILARNLTTLFLGVLTALPFAASIIFISPAGLDWGRIADGLLYAWSVVPALLHFGNMQSIRYPRPSSGLRMHDIGEMIWLLVSLAVLSLPFLLFCELLDFWPVCVAYGAGWWIYWWRVSPLLSAERIHARMDELLERS